MTLPGKFLGGFTGWLVDHVGYVWFFIDTAIAGLPAIALLIWLVIQAARMPDPARSAP